MRQGVSATRYLLHAPSRNRAAVARSRCTLAPAALRLLRCWTVAVLPLPTHFLPLSIIGVVETANGGRHKQGDAPAEVDEEEEPL